jgi:hypothetical protein
MSWKKSDPRLIERDGFRQMYGPCPVVRGFMLQSERTKRVLYFQQMEEVGVQQVRWRPSYSFQVLRACTGIIMSLHLFDSPTFSEATSSKRSTELRLLCAYENGSVELRRFSRKDKQTSVEGQGWDSIWSIKLHVEASESSYLSTIA